MARASPSVANLKVDTQSGWGPPRQVAGARLRAVVEHKLETIRYFPRVRQLELGPGRCEVPNNAVVSKLAVLENDLGSLESALSRSLPHVVAHLGIATPRTTLRQGKTVGPSPGLHATSVARKARPPPLVSERQRPVYLAGGAPESTTRCGDFIFGFHAVRSSRSRSSESTSEARRTFCSSISRGSVSDAPPCCR